MPTTSNLSFVNKVPPDFVERTISRLLPGREVIEAMSPDELTELAQRVSELKRVIPLEPIKWYLPNPGGQWDFMVLDDPTIRVLLFVAGNKTGKTTAGAVKMVELMTGEMLWGHGWRAAPSLKTPAYGCVFAEDFDSHKEVTLPAYLSWCPPRYIKDIKRNPAGSIVHIEHTNGSFLFFRTYDQGSDKAEGKDWNAVWCDEPPPRTIYTAVLRGLVTLNGIFFITATLLKETWLYDEAEGHDFVKMFLSTIYDNPWLSDQARADFISSLSDDERAVRVQGKPVSLTGLIYKEFVDGPPFIIPQQEFPSEWPIVMVVDPHERKPLYVMWAVITPSNTLIFFDWANPPSLPEFKEEPTARLTLIQRELLRHETSHHGPSQIVIMDPNRGPAKQLDGRCWRDVFEEWGYSTLMGNDDIRIGHSMVHEYLGARRLRFTENLRGKGGPVWQFLRYAWDDWVLGRKDNSKALKEVPRQNYKDFPDCIRYAVMAELDFDTLRYGPRVIDRLVGQSRGRFGIRAGL